MTRVNFYKEHNFLNKATWTFYYFSDCMPLIDAHYDVVTHTAMITSALLPLNFYLCTCVPAVYQSIFVPTERTRRSPHWQWESSVRTKSPRPYSPLRTGVRLCLWISCNFSCCCSRILHSSASPSSGTSTTSAACCPAPSKWTAAPCSSTRSSFHRCQTSKQEAVSFSRRLALHVALVFLYCWQSYVSVSAGFFPFLKIYQSLQLVYTSGV